MQLCVRLVETAQLLGPRAFLLSSAGGLTPRLIVPGRGCPMTADEFRYLRAKLERLRGEVD